MNTKDFREEEMRYFVEELCPQADTVLRFLFGLTLSKEVAEGMLGDVFEKARTAAQPHRPSAPSEPTR